MSQSNQVLLIGRAGTDVEMREYDGNNFGSFRLVTSSSKKGEDGKWEEFDQQWHSIGLKPGFSDRFVKNWGTEVKGVMFMVKGTITYREDPKTKGKVYTTIRADDVRPFAQIPKTEESSGNGPSMDDIPF